VKVAALTIQHAVHQSSDGYKSLDLKVDLFSLFDSEFLPSNRWCHTRLKPVTQRPHPGQPETTGLSQQ